MGKNKPRTKLREARLEKGLSLGDAARLAGYAGAPGWANVEAGARKPSLEQMAAMARAVGKTPLEVFPELAQVLGGVKAG